MCLPRTNGASPPAQHVEVEAYVNAAAVVQQNLMRRLSKGVAVDNAGHAAAARADASIQVPQRLETKLFLGEVGFEREERLIHGDRVANQKCIYHVRQKMIR